MQDELFLAKGPPTVYLGLSGVLHPSESTYRLLRGCSPWTDGHSKYEGAKTLEETLQMWPTLRIVLTSTLPWAHGLPAVLESLGPRLAARVDGYTYRDLTTRIDGPLTRPDGTKQALPVSAEEYWRLNKSAIVAIHVAWRKPTSWVVLDDENIAWPTEVRKRRLMLTNPCKGLFDASAVERLRAILNDNFSVETG